MVTRVAVDLLAVLGFVSMVAGLYLVFGVGVALIVAGVLFIVAAILIQRGWESDGPRP